MRFSIIVPVYNVERYLGECLESVAFQDYDDYEVVIVDDGSTDGSAAVYERFAAEASFPMRIVKQGNSGLLRARRAGIKAAHGDYLWHVDGDDCLAPGAMRTVSKTIDEYEPDVILLGMSEAKDFTTVLPGNLDTTQGHYAGNEMNEVRMAFLRGAIPNMVTKVASRACVDIDHDYAEYGRLQLGEDQLQSLFILDAATSCCCIREPLYYYRPNSTSITSRYREGQIADYALVKEAVYRQAVLWDQKWPGYKFTESMLAGYLSNGYYDMRKNVGTRHFTKQFQEFAETSLYPTAIEYRGVLRADQRVFYALLNNKNYVLAYWCILICRAMTRLVRKASR